MYTGFKYAKAGILEVSFISFHRFLRRSRWFRGRGEHPSLGGAIADGPVAGWDLPQAVASSLQELYDPLTGGGWDSEFGAEDIYTRCHRSHSKVCHKNIFKK